MQPQFVRVRKNRTVTMAIMATATWLALNVIFTPYLNMMKDNIAFLRTLLGD